MAHAFIRARATFPLMTGLLSAGVYGQPVESKATFEVASVKLSNGGGRPSIGLSPGGERFFVRNMPLLWIISSAFDVSIRQISGLPKAFDSKSYDIEAKTAEPASPQEMMRMLQRLLGDRFKLRLRHESKELRVYVLAVAKGGSKMDENVSGAGLDARNSGAGREAYRDISMPIFANLLAGKVQETVIDKTGLTGSFDFKLEFTPERLGPGAQDGHEPPPNLDGPSLFTALREQLGLELRRETAAVGILFIDQIEEPVEN